MRWHPSVVLKGIPKDSPFSIEQLLTRSTLTILGCFSIFYLFLVQHVRLTNYRDPTSYFFDPTRAYEPIYSADRIKESDAFIQSAELAAAGQPPTIQPPIMCIGIVTLARTEEQYVQRTIGSLLEGLTPEERSSIYLNVLIAHTDPSTHPISSEPWAKTIPNKLLRYKHADVARVQEWEDGGGYQNKTLFDYKYLLNDCYMTGAEYIAMIEDDTVAVSGWYPRTMEALRNVETAMERRGGYWSTLRLFYTERFFGWNGEYWPLYLFWSLMCWGILTGSLIFARTKLRPVEAYLSDTALLVVSGVCIPALIALFFAAGRNSHWPLAPGIHEMNSFGCCSQAYVFPRNIVPPFLQKSNVERNWPLDVMVEEIASEQGWIRWAITPALVQHIGMASTKGYGFEHFANNIWNFGFELYKQPRV